MAYVIKTDGVIVAYSQAQQDPAGGWIELDDNHPELVAFTSGQTKPQLIHCAGGSAYNLLLKTRAYTLGSTTVLANATYATRTDLQDLSRWGAANNDATRVWIDDRGIATSLNGVQYVQLAELVAAYVLSVYDVAAQVIAGVNAGSVTTISQIDSFSWPSTNT